MKNILKYRLFYWFPNTIAGDRIAIGLILYDEENERFDIHWISQRDLTRIGNIFSFSRENDTKDILALFRENKGNWKSKAFDPEFWTYIERYWNGIIQISPEKKLIYDGTSGDFNKQSQNLQQHFLPLIDSHENRQSDQE